MTLKLNSIEQEAIDEFKNALGNQFGDKLRLIKLFGSKARGDFNQDSDIDILVVTTEKDIELAKEIHGLAIDVSLKYGVYLSVKVFDEAQFDYLNRLRTTFMTSIKTEGRTVWPRDSGDKDTDLPRRRIAVKNKLKEKIDKKLQKSHRKLETATQLLERGRYEDAISRAYYAMYHAALALLMTKNIAPRTHKGVSLMLNLHFITPGLLDRSYGRMFSYAQDLRESSDYEDEYEGTEEDAKAVIEEAIEFVKKMEELISSAK